MHPSLMFLKFPLIIQNGLLCVLGHVITEKHWDREGLGRQYYKDSTTMGHFRYIRIHHKNEF